VVDLAGLEMGSCVYDGTGRLLLKKKSLEKERYTITIFLRRYWKIIKTLVQYYYIFYLKGFYLGN
jgi:hypothetical protein